MSLPPSAPDSDRRRWLEIAHRIADPVLVHQAAGRLREAMPVEVPCGNAEERRAATHLEAFGRTLAGIAPWLELEQAPPEEAGPQARWRELARQGLAQLGDPASPDSFQPTQQGLVDGAFLAHACLRAPRELWGKLEAPVQERLVGVFQEIARLQPYENNWLLFSAMIEVFLARVGAPFKPEAIEYALRRHEEWYQGDGAYGDGPGFAWDYYNSYVIQPFLLDIVGNLPPALSGWERLREPVAARALRYAAVQERLIGVDGSFPPLGRSLAYRCGAFQHLAQMALRGELPPEVTPGQARCALTAVIRRTLEAPGTFDAAGWLRVGLAGHQPGLAEAYISTGSLYLCAFAFLPLGLPASAPFWSAPAAPWTAQRLWSGEDRPADHALHA